ncbi:MAG: hypothetical protein ACREUK_00300, partial [Burkholderiales bacterium]
RTLVPSGAVTPSLLTTRLPWGVSISVTPLFGSIRYAVPPGPVRTYRAPLRLSGLYGMPVAIS